MFNPLCGRALMERDISVPAETFRKGVDVSLAYVNRFTRQARRLLLVEDLVDSLKVCMHTHTPHTRDINVLQT